MSGRSPRVAVPLSQRVLWMPVLSLMMLSLLGCSGPEAERCQVSGASSALEATALRESCERAVPDVEALWSGWSGEVPIVLSQSALPPGVAAQVEGSVRPGQPAEGDRLVIGPDLAQQLSADGLDVVMRHELTHLAMRSTGTSPVPTWGSEGLAEWAGYRGVADDRSDRPGDLRSLLSSVQAKTWPGTLPSAAQLQDPDTREEAYTAAWLGISVLIDELGVEAVTEGMRAGGNEQHEDGAALSEALRTDLFLQRLGVSRGWLDERWRSEIERRAA